MASVEKRPDGRWRARWREFPGGPQKSKHFPRKADAERWLVEIQHQLQTGRYVDPAAGMVGLRHYAEEWLARRRWRPATRDRVERNLRLHIYPTFGERPLTSLRRPQIERWAAELPLAPSSVGTVSSTLHTLLETAVEDGLLAHNPARGWTLPSAETAPVVPLLDAEVHRLIEVAPAELRAAFVLEATTGLRQGELAAVGLERVDFLRRTLRVDVQVWTPRNAAPVLAAPKSRRSYRTIALADVSIEALARHVERFPPAPNGLLFHRGGGMYTRDVLGSVMRKTSKSAGVEATWHSLRHYHASVLLSAGVSPALVAERLGHDMATLIRVYAHVIRSDEDRVRAIVDKALAEPAEDRLRTRRLSGGLGRADIPAQ